MFHLKPSLFVDERQSILVWPHLYFEISKPLVEDSGHGTRDYMMITTTTVVDNELFLVIIMMSLFLG